MIQSRAERGRERERTEIVREIERGVREDRESEIERRGSKTDRVREIERGGVRENRGGSGRGQSGRGQRGSERGQRVRERRGSKTDRIREIERGGSERHQKERECLGMAVNDLSRDKEIKEEENNVLV